MTFTGTTADPRVLTTINQDPGQATTDQWWQWTAFTKLGKLAVSYYDRRYGTDETTGLHGLAIWWSEHPDVSRTALVDAVMEMAWAGLRSQFATTKPARRHG